MKQAGYRRMVCALLCIFLSVSSICSAEPFSIRSILTDTCSQPVRITIGDITYSSFSAFDGKRLEQLNRLLRHASLRLLVDRDCSVSAFLLDDREIFSISTEEDGDSVLSSCSLIPDQIIRLKKESGNQGTAAFFSENIFMRLNILADQFYPYFASLKDLDGCQKREEDVTLNFKGFGKAVRRVTYTFSAEYVREHFPEVLVKTAETPDQKELIGKLVFTGSQRIILLYDAEEKLVRISYDGRLGTDAADIRNVSLVWKCVRNGETVRDSINLKSPAISGYDRDNLTFIREYATGANQNHAMNWHIQLDQKKNQIRKLISFDAETEESETAFAGKAEYSEKYNGKKISTSVNCRLTKENLPEYAGTLEIADYSGKIEKKRMQATLSIKPGEPVVRKGADPAKVIEAETQEGRVFLDHLRWEFSRAIVRGLSALPAGDVLFLSEDIPEDVWKDIIQ